MLISYHYARPRAFAGWPVAAGPLSLGRIIYNIDHLSGVVDGPDVQSRTLINISRRDRREPVLAHGRLNASRKFTFFMKSFC